MPWHIPETDLDQAKRQTDLVALVQSRGIELKKHGSKDFIGRCPFHEDRDKPNFIVTPGKGLFHCMACGKAGNAIQFVQHHDGVSFRHAFELLRQGSNAALHSAADAKAIHRAAFALSVGSGGGRPGVVPPGCFERLQN